MSTSIVAPDDGWLTWDPSTARPEHEQAPRLMAASAVQASGSGGSGSSNTSKNDGSGSEAKHQDNLGRSLRSPRFNSGASVGSISKAKATSVAHPRDPARAHRSRMVTDQAHHASIGGNHASSSSFEHTQNSGQDVEGQSTSNEAAPSNTSVSSAKTPAITVKLPNTKLASAKTVVPSPTRTSASHPPSAVSIQMEMPNQGKSTATPAPDFSPTVPSGNGWGPAVPVHSASIDQPSTLHPGTSALAASSSSSVHCAMPVNKAVPVPSTFPVSKRTDLVNFLADLHRSLLGRTTNNGCDLIIELREPPGRMSGHSAATLDGCNVFLKGDNTQVMAAKLAVDRWIRERTPAATGQSVSNRQGSLQPAVPVQDLLPSSQQQPVHHRESMDHEGSTDDHENCTFKLAVSPRLCDVLAQRSRVIGGICQLRRFAAGPDSWLYLVGTRKTVEQAILVIKVLARCLFPEYVTNEPRLATMDPLSAQVLARMRAQGGRQGLTVDRIPGALHRIRNYFQELGSETTASGVPTNAAPNVDPGTTDEIVPEQAAPVGAGVGSKVDIPGSTVSVLGTPDPSRACEQPSRTSLAAPAMQQRHESTQSSAGQISVHLDQPQTLAEKPNATALVNSDSQDKAARSSRRSGVNVSDLCLNIPADIATSFLGRKLANLDLLQRHLPCQSVVYNVEEETLTLSDDNDDALRFARRVISVLVRITEWGTQPKSHELRLESSLDAQVLEWFMSQKDAMRGVMSKDRIPVLISKMRKTLASGTFEDERLVFPSPTEMSNCGPSSSLYASADSAHLPSRLGWTLESAGSESVPAQAAGPISERQTGIQTQRDQLPLADQPDSAGTGAGDSSSIIEPLPSDALNVSTAQAAVSSSSVDEPKVARVVTVLQGTPSDDTSENKLRSSLQTQKDAQRQALVHLLNKAVSQPSEVLSTLALALPPTVYNQLLGTQAFRLSVLERMMPIKRLSFDDATYTMTVTSDDGISAYRSRTVLASLAYFLLFSDKVPPDEVCEKEKRARQKLSKGLPAEVRSLVEKLSSSPEMAILPLLPMEAKVPMILSKLSTSQELENFRYEEKAGLEEANGVISEFQHIDIIGKSEAVVYLIDHPKMLREIGVKLPRSHEDELVPESEHYLTANEEARAFDDPAANWSDLAHRRRMELLGSAYYIADTVQRLLKKLMHISNPFYGDEDDLGPSASLRGDHLDALDDGLDGEGDRQTATPWQENGDWDLPDVTTLKARRASTLLWTSTLQAEASSSPVAASIDPVRPPTSTAVPAFTAVALHATSDALPRGTSSRSESPAAPPRENEDWKNIVQERTTSHQTHRKGKTHSRESSGQHDHASSYSVDSLQQQYDKLRQLYLSPMPAFQLPLPGDSFVRGQVIGSRCSGIMQLSLTTNTYIQLAANVQRWSHKQQHQLHQPLEFYGPKDRCMLAMRRVVERVWTYLPTWRFAGENADMINEWREESERAKREQASKAPHATSGWGDTADNAQLQQPLSADKNSSPSVSAQLVPGQSKATKTARDPWISEDSGLPLYMVYAPPEALVAVRSWQSQLIRKDQTSSYVKEDEMHITQFNFYGHQAECEELLIQFRDVVRCFDPEWLPGGDEGAKKVMVQQDEEDARLAARRAAFAQISSSITHSNGSGTARSTTTISGEHHRQEDALRASRSPTTSVSKGSSKSQKSADTHASAAGHLQTTSPVTVARSVDLAPWQVEARRAIARNGGVAGLQERSENMVHVASGWEVPAEAAAAQRQEEREKAGGQAFNDTNDGSSARHYGGCGGGAGEVAYGVKSPSMRLEAEDAWNLDKPDPYYLEYKIGLK